MDEQPQGEVVWDARCGTGESPVWEAETGRLLFADIPAGQIHALDTRSGRRSTITLPEVVPSFGLCRSGRLVVALRDRVVLFDRGSNEVIPLTEPFGQPEDCRLNDGKVGPDGCFWVGGFHESKPRRPICSLYRVTPEGKVERKLDGLAASNGLAWTADGRTMFHADSSGPWIDAWDFDPATGHLSSRRRLVTLDDEAGRPDGGAADEDGHYWSAGVSGDHLNCFSPEGALLRRLRLPLPAPTMPCFAGGHLYVTSLREGRDPQMLERFPQMGGLMRVPAPARGVAVGRFADS